MSEAGSLEREENELIDVLNYVLRERGYNNLKVANREGKQRIVIAGDWGINGNTMKRWIKVDRIPEGENAGRLAAKGYATERDIGVLLGIKEPEKHYLTKVVDFIDLGMFGYGLASGEDDFSGCSSLSNYTAKNGPLSQKEWLDLVSQGLIAERYLIEGTGLFHKDVKPGNFLVRGVDGGLEIRLTDFVIAGKIKDARESLLPSFGGHIVTDPLLMGCFTGKRRAYGEDSEIYSFGNTLLYALLGRFCFDYNSFNKTAVSCKGGEDLLRDGMLDADRHKRVFKKELKELPRWARIYREMLTKCLTLEESERYGSFRELQADFENVLNPGFFGRLRYSLGAKIGSGVLVAGLGVGGFFFDRYFGKTADLASKEEERISCFGSEWNGRDLGIGNNYMVAKVSAHLKGNYDGNTEKGFLCVNHRDTVEVMVSARKSARPGARSQGDYNFEGRIYLEGWEGALFSIMPLPYNETLAWDDSGDGYGNSCIERKIGIPDSSGEGVRFIAVEIYAPETEEKNICFAHPGRVLERKRIPLVIGSPRDTIDISYIRFSYNDDVSFRNIGGYGPISKDIAHFFKVSGEDSGKITDGRHMNLPKGSDCGEKILRINSRQRGQDVFATYTPVRRKPIGDNGLLYWWEPYIPGKDFYKKLIDFRSGKY